MGRIDGEVLDRAADYRERRSGWSFAAGCWHGPVSVCRCFVGGLVRDFLADVAAPRTAPAR